LRIFPQNLREDGTEPVNINDLQTGQIASDRNWLDDAGSPC